MIKITDDLRIVSNSTSWMVEERKIVQDKESENFGKEVCNNIGNFGKITHCFNKILDVKRKEIANKRINIDKFLEEDAKLRKWIMEIFEPFENLKKEVSEE